MGTPKALAKQLDLPISFTPSGEMVTLREFVKNKEAPYLSLSSLTYTQRAKITAERIRREPEVKLAMVGAGVIDKERAIAEVEAETPVGQALIEAEQYVIRKLVDEAEKGRLKEIISSTHA
jgi:hypothetical protein